MAMGEGDSNHVSICSGSAAIVNVNLLPVAITDVS